MKSAEFLGLIYFSKSLVSKIFTRIKEVSPQNPKEEGQLLFPSFVLWLQSEVCQYVGDTSKGAVFIPFDEARCMPLDVFKLIKVTVVARVLGVL